MTTYSKLLKALKSVQSKVDFKPEVALILGSGLGDFAEDIEVKYTLNYSEIDEFPISTVEGHKGRFIFGYIDSVPVIIMQGRVHYYEGYDIKDVVMPTRLMGLLGAKVLFITNAAGGANFNFKSGDFMLIEDQIANFVPSPLNGENIEKLGTRFPDMSEIYNKELKSVILNTAKDLNITLQQGVYIQLPGPNFETPAEVKMCRALGADAIGMSTGCEAIAANHMGMKICGISCISNLCSGMSKKPLSDGEVYETASRVAVSFKKLIRESIIKIAEVL